MDPFFDQNVGRVYLNRFSKVVKKWSEPPFLGPLFGQNPAFWGTKPIFKSGQKSGNLPLFEHFWKKMI